MTQQKDIVKNNEVIINNDNDVKDGGYSELLKKYKDDSGRKIVQIIKAIEKSEGRGARVKRSIGTQKLPNFDPFLMLDYFMVEKGVGGFPTHPHAGQQTVTFMLEGKFKHKDSLGNVGVIEPFQVQCMSAGRGIAHSEMPEAEGINTGMQLWINLSEIDKDTKPHYQDVDELPSVTKDGVTVKVVTGKSSLGIESSVVTLTPYLYYYVEMEKNSKHFEIIPKDWNAFAYIIDGTGYFGKDAKKKISGSNTITFDLSKKSDILRFETKDDKVRFVLIAGKPIGEKIVQYGPFVQTSFDMIKQKHYEYQTGSGGFDLSQYKDDNLQFKKK